MSATRELPLAPARQEGAARPDGPDSRPGRGRAVLVVAGLVVAGLVVLLFVGPRGPDPTDPLEPGNPDPAGARALARVLADRGVHVTVVHGEPELEAAEVDRDTTVFVTSTENLSAHTSRRVRDLSADAGALVLAGAGPTTLRALGLRMDAAPAFSPGSVPAACDDPLLAGLEIEVPPTTAHGPRGVSGLTETCFPVEVDGATYGLVTHVAGRPGTYLVGAVELFANGQIAAADDAAVALRLLGQHQRVVWYVADAADVPAGDGGRLSALLPPWLWPALALLGLALVATILWRGRRLGPLVVEPLPVVVKAIESTTSRGLLYARARDREHVARTLREATAVRLAEHLRLPRHTGVDQLVPAVAPRVGRSQDDVRRLLAEGPVADDRALTELAQNLIELEREVRQP